jgi:hypothetical protein
MEENKHCITLPHFRQGNLLANWYIITDPIDSLQSTANKTPTDSSVGGFLREGMRKTKWRN